MFNDNGRVYVCTGTLLNNVAQDGTPYFLTANHCVNSQAVAQTVEAYWFYQTTSCNSGVLRNWVHSPPGANLLATQGLNDFSLLRLQNNAPGGGSFPDGPPWRNQQALVFSGFITPTRISRQPSIHTYDGRLAVFRTRMSNCFCDLVNGYGIDWTSGTAEPGSSGSGLFTSNGHYLVGVLSCGPVLGPRCNSSSRIASSPTSIPKYDRTVDSGRAVGANS